MSISRDADIKSSLILLFETWTRYGSLASLSRARTANSLLNYQFKRIKNKLYGLWEASESERRAPSLSLTAHFFNVCPVISDINLVRGKKAAFQTMCWRVVIFVALLPTCCDQFGSFLDHDGYILEVQVCTLACLHSDTLVKIPHCFRGSSDKSPVQSAVRTLWHVVRIRGAGSNFTAANERILQGGLITGRPF